MRVEEVIPQMENGAVALTSLSRCFRFLVWSAACLLSRSHAWRAVAQGSWRVALAALPPNGDATFNALPVPSRCVSQKPHLGKITSTLERSTIGAVGVAVEATLGG